MFDGWGDNGFADFEKQKNVAIPKIANPNPEQVALLGELTETRDQNIRRRSAVIEKLREWGEGSPYLATGVRPTRGGLVQALKPFVWSNQQLSNSWFYCCKLDHKDPLGYGVSGPNFWHIFLFRKQFEALVRIHYEGSDKESDLVAAGVKKAQPVLFDINAGVAGIQMPAQPQAMQETPAVSSPSDRKSNAGKKTDKVRWGEFAAALAYVADRTGIDPIASDASIHKSVADFLESKGRTPLEIDSVRDAILLAKHWLNGHLHPNDPKPEANLADHD